MPNEPHRKQVSSGNNGYHCEKKELARETVMLVSGMTRPKTSLALQRENETK